MHITPTKDQKLLCNELKHWYKKRTKPYYVYSGQPGTGKTFTIKMFVEEIGLSYNDVVAAAYVGKAVLVLLKHGLNASTIHSLIYRPIIKEELSGEYDSKGRAKKKQKITFMLREELKNLVKLMIIDEASMVNDKILSDLLSFDIPIVFIGDHNQLAPVFGSSSIMNKPDFILREIMRQCQDSPIIKFLQDILDDKPLLYGNYGNSRIINKLEVDKKLLTDYDIIICGKNKTREKMNNIIRHEVLHIEKEDPILGDKLINRQNDWDSSIDNIYLTNGLIGYITDIDYSNLNKKYINIDFRPDFMSKSFYDLELDYNYFHTDISNRNNYGMSKYNKFEYGYCITTHLCISKDTLIYTEDGIMELRDLEFYNKKIYNGSYMELPSKYIDNGIDKVNILKLSNGTEYNVTDLHKCKILSSNGILDIYGKDINVGDELLLRINQNLYTEKIYKFNYEERIYKKGTLLYNLPHILTDELSLIIGMICADGTITKCSIRYHKSDIDCITLFSELIQKLFNCETFVKHLEYEDCWICEVFSVQIRDFFYNIKGLRPNKKYVPECILQSSISNQCHFMKGLFEDGGVHLKKGKFDMIALTFKNNKMINQLNAMLTNIDISPTFSKVYKGKSVLNVLYIFKNDAFLFRKKIGFISKHKQSRLDGILYKYSKIGSNVLAKMILTNISHGRNKYVNNLRRGGILTQHSFIKIYDSLSLEERNSEWILFIKYIFDNYKILTVTNITEDYKDTACLEMPETHMFLQNGILGGNSQGSEYNNILFIDQPFHDRETTKRLRYTAVSRARESITIIKDAYNL